MRSTLLASLTALVLFLAITPCNATPCNTKEGGTGETNPLPTSDDMSGLAQISPNDPTLMANPRRDPWKDWSLDLGRDLISLDMISGPSFENSPVLLLRLENLPGFDAKRHCNRIFPMLGKPQIFRLDGKKVRAELDRYSLTFDADAPPAALMPANEDKTGRVYWLFPRVFGRGKTSPWEMTRSFAQAFGKAPPGSRTRAWIAQTYLNLAMRTYRDKELARRFPIGALPGRAELDRRFANAGADCTVSPEDLVCLAAKLIETNEVGHPRVALGRDAFRTSDAIYGSSGVTVGIQQLDVAVNDEARLLMPRWMPKTIGRYPQYRRKIRHWTIDDLNRWYATDAVVANEEISTQAGRDAILDAYVTFFVQAQRRWQPRIATRYPAWPKNWQNALAMFAIDLENVSGYVMYLPDDARAPCDVLISDHRRVIEGKRSKRYNSLYLNDLQISARLRNGRDILAGTGGFADLDLSCVT